MNRTFFLAAVSSCIFLLLSSCLDLADSPEQEEALPPETEVSPPADENQAPTPESSPMLLAVNALRTEGCRCGNKNMPAVPPLKWNNKLEKAATGHAKDMSNNDFFNHTGSNGSQVGDRAKSAGYTWSAIGENIAWGKHTVKSVVQSWMESPGHCQNMMGKQFTEMGSAQADNYWVQVFGKGR